jgi:hypothetical protein
MAIAMMYFMSGCSTTSTEPDEVALHYTGGSFSSKNFEKCIDASDRSVDGPGDQHYVYPKGNRTFSFTGKDGSEAGPIAVTTKDGQEVFIPGFVTFTLNTDCKTLREFHEKIGKKYEAYKDGKDGKGWTEFLNDYVYTPLDSAMNRASLEADGWYALYSDAAVQNEFEEAVKDSLPDEVIKALGGDFITVNAVQISKPSVSDGLKKGLSAKEEARLSNDAQKELNEKSRTQYQTIADCLVTGLSEENCTLIFLSQNGADIPFLPIPQGGAVNFQPQK